MASSIRINTINHVGIPIWDRRVSLPFYRDILGLQVIPSMVDEQNIVWTRTFDGTMVHLIEPADGENLVQPHTAYEVDDFDTVLTELRNSDFPDITEPGERYDGQRYVFIYDNDRNRLEFVTASDLRLQRAWPTPMAIRAIREPARMCDLVSVPNILQA